ncbi:STAS domain-containing protein [Herbihabitans rhizosphaerae]|uniref:STAS domain-containing protein n=1 Tax=Herbihabitans rhizosphaerae TaxID=1872711 RepID=UPI0013EECE02|nr:STAS domain-containing protein [Herbihabitans rhizosphaerae]
MTPIAVQPGVLAIEVRGDVDLCTSPVLRDRLFGHLHHGDSLLIVDLRAVKFLGLAGVTDLATVRIAAVEMGIRFRVVAHTYAVLMPLRITEMDRVLDVHPDLAHALARVSDGRTR